MAMAERGGKAENFLCSKQLHLIAKTAIVSFKGANAVVLHRTNIVATTHHNWQQMMTGTPSQPIGVCMYALVDRQQIYIYM